MKTEYKTFKSQGPDLNTKLNEFAEIGWEYVNMCWTGSDYRVVMQRKRDCNV